MVKTQVPHDETRTIDQWVQEAETQGGPIDLYAGKRREPRRTWMAMLDVHVLIGKGEGEFIYATSRDISDGGLAFLARRQLAIGTKVGIYLSGSEHGVTGIVRHCTPTLTGYIVGVEFVARLGHPSEAKGRTRPGRNRMVHRSSSSLAWLR